MRLDFQQRLQVLHTRTLARHSDMKTPAEEEAAHEEWTQRLALQPKRQKKEGPRMPCLACCAEASGSA
jgi:hypothetical protein